MKKQENEKQLRELSDEELEKVTGGAIGWIHGGNCNSVINPCEPGMVQNPINCQCEPMPNTIARKEGK